MKHVPTGILRSAPDCLSPPWKHVFDTLARPINLIIGLRDILVTDSRNPVPQIAAGTLHYYNRDVSSARNDLHRTLQILDINTPKTFDVGHAIHKAVGPVATALSKLSALSNAKISFTREERQEFFDDTRRRILEACEKLDDRALLQALRESVVEEREIDLAIKGPEDGVWPIQISVPTGGTRARKPIEESEQAARRGEKASSTSATRGRRITERNKKIYRTCNEQYKRVVADQIKMAKAVAEVLRIHGLAALGRNASLQDQKTRLRMNAKTYRNSKQFEGERK